ncbi:MAG: hypothetical protein ACOVNY_11180 [Chitinophagaceae bacterium]|jgi:hypothetical protein
MKKVFLFFACTVLCATWCIAQDAPAKPELTKEEKAKLKQKQEEETNAAFKEVGLTEEQINSIKEANVEAGKKSAEVRKDATLSDDAKKEKIKEINDQKTDKIKTIMGIDKYRQFLAIRKKQKEAAALAP